MKTNIKIPYHFALVLIFFQAQLNGQSLQSPNELIVKFKNEVNINSDWQDQLSIQLAELDELNADFPTERVTALSSANVKPRCFLLKFATTGDLDETIKAYVATDLFEYVEPNFIGEGAGRKSEDDVLPSDIYFNRQYGLHNTGSFTLSAATVDADVDMDQAWEIEQGDPSIIVAVLDAGTRMSHPEFAGRIWMNSDEIENSTDTDNNGFIDDVLGWDFVNDDNDPVDDHGHGTNVAGIIASNGDNGVGYAGVDWNCKLMSCKILDSENRGFYSWWIASIYYAVDQGADVINMSVGGSSYSAGMADALDYAYAQGVVVVACMMNFDNDRPYYPAAYDHTIAVGSTNPDDSRTAPFFWSATSGSNYGPHIDVVAPGNYIYGLNYQSNTNYGSYWGGTSQATPLVAGIASLLLAQDPSLTPDQVREILRNTAEDEVGKISEDLPGFDHYHGYGRVNAYDALMLAVTATENEKKNQSNISIFPNPTSQSFNLLSDISISKIMIYNSNGKLSLVRHFNENQQKETIDVGTLNSGIYSMQFYNEDRNLKVTKKLIVE